MGGIPTWVLTIVRPHNASVSQKMDSQSQVGVSCQHT